jgi:hypothetical protein
MQKHARHEQVQDALRAEGRTMQRPPLLLLVLLSAACGQREGAFRCARGVSMLQAR